MIAQITRTNTGIRITLDTTDTAALRLAQILTAASYFDLFPEPHRNVARTLGQLLHALLRSGKFFPKHTSTIPTPTTPGGKN